MDMSRALRITPRFAGKALAGLEEARIIRERKYSERIALNHEYSL